MNELRVYGIPNCDTIKKTLAWLNKNKIGFEFHDYKISGISKAKLTEWCRKTGYEILLNKKSTTWRSLSPPVQEKTTNQPAAIKLMVENTSLIKRPVIEYGDELLIGYDEEAFKRTFKK